MVFREQVIHQDMAPEDRHDWAAVIGSLASGLACIVALVSLVIAAPEDRRGLPRGKTALACPFLIAIVAAPVLAALLALLKRLAPTRLVVTGAAAGFLAGAVATFVYALHCPENGLPFVILWYTAGVLLSSAIGALLVPRVLRW
ncbi:NrsF family protein [Paracoccus aestuariivivens]|nr:NrsF family protein [Paracoccus aestuariivivens]